LSLSSVICCFIQFSSVFLLCIFLLSNVFYYANLLYQSTKNYKNKNIISRENQICKKKYIKLEHFKKKRKTWSEVVIQPNDFTFSIELKSTSIRPTLLFEKKKRKSIGYKMTSPIMSSCILTAWPCFAKKNNGPIFTNLTTKAPWNTKKSNCKDRDRS